MGGLDTGAISKLKEANYFLNHMKKFDILHATSLSEFDYYHSAFLSAWASVMDLMLFNFANKYRLGFSDEDRLDEERFEIAARALKHDQAMKFLAWYKGEKKNMREKDALLRKITSKRHMNIHRARPEVNYAMEVHEFYMPTGSMGVSAVLQPTAVGVDNVTEDTAPDRTFLEIAQIWYQDIPNIDVRDVCNYAFEYMKRIVETARKEYWNRS